MANTITDNRTLLFNGGDGTGGQPDNLTGVATGTTDTSTYLSGATSYTASFSNTRDGMLFDAGTAQNYANNHFSLTVNSGVVGLLDLKANGGFTVRFCGATVTDWFEVYVGGSDSWPPTIQGGWANFVVDIELARSTAVTNGWTNGTTPATSAIRYVGFTQILTTMPKMADNTWFDTLHRVADGTPGVLIQGRNGGTTDWNTEDIITQLGTGQVAFRRGAGGSYVLSTPIQVGVNDTTTHGFTDTNSIWLWDTQEFVASDHYKVSALGNAGGTTNVTFGTKAGSGNTATGSQGLTIAAASSGARWSMDFNDPNLDLVGLYGCSFQHGGAFLFDDSAVSVISTLLIDCTSALIPTITDFLKNKVINDNTTSGVAFLNTDNLTDIVKGEFEFSAGHAVELTSLGGGSMTWDNIATGYAAVSGSVGNETIYINVGSGNLTVNVATGATTPTYRTAGALVTIVAGAVTYKWTITDIEGTVIENARVFVEAASGGLFPYQASVSITRVGTTATVSHNLHGLENGDKVVIRGVNQREYYGIKTISNVSTNAYDFTVSGSPTTPATGTITSTYVFISGLTNASGIIQGTKTFLSNQPISGNVRKSSSAPYFKTGVIIGTINSSTGLDSRVILLSDG